MDQTCASPRPGRGPGAAADERPAVLLACHDPVLADEAERAAVAAGVRVVRPSLDDPAPWPDGLLVVDAGLASVAARRRSTGRGAVVLVAAEEAGPGGGASVYQLATAVRADHVVRLPSGRGWLVELLSRAVETGACGRVVAVIGGCGGAGASVLAVGLGVAAAADGGPVALVDLDVRGGGLDLALGLDDVAGLRWPDLLAARGRLPASSIRDSLPRRGSLGVLSWGRDGPADLPLPVADAVLDAVGRGHELVVLDLARGGDAGVDRALRRVDDLLVVVPTRVRAVSAATQLVRSLGPAAARARVVVRRVPGERWAAGAVADAVGAPLAATMREDPRLDAGLARGEPPMARGRGPVFAAAEQCLVSWRPSDRVVPA